MTYVESDGTVFQKTEFGEAMMSGGFCREVYQFAMGGDVKHWHSQTSVTIIGDNCSK
ncbi:hypothetical protein ROA7450_03807 [Roseovarius albus]|uniref:Uncharacterized protein n=1 Tax=Roseovarius albus TaxID=1247867 RepID=A0A1X7A3Z2_9RHOB|nr:hypothetical protein [Roseovarius albus]SLN69982.1 hypothetical protein ROA7450_03807 [Roseovarius albus]